MDEKNLVWLAGGTVDESRLMLRFFGDDLDPDFVSQRLGSPPTESCRKGDLHRKGRILEKTGRWVLEKERTAEPVAECLLQLFGSLTNDLAVWKELTHRFHGDLRCHLIAKRWNREQTLRPQVLAAIADRGLELIIDVYFEPEDEGRAEPLTGLDSQ
ncbi:hypothetical protein AYO44_05095 [Planctomycetaceae bacterium SCGC AG-212-F19]|nr:hypothetical protein AYO44_05095 [Planctomycetaceae bacterium SCGC AG-212-F19]